MSDRIHLGFEIGTGNAVEIPLRHMVVTGQTQEAGKTTALEALIVRSKMKAIAFVTKRGEGSFHNARTIQPYFREQADWQFVASILEASRGEKLKFERAWIIRASKGARTLADVQRNVRRAMDDPKTRGMSADVYLTLDAYLEAVVPQIAHVRWATAVDLAPGLNVMDMTGLNVEMQHLVIRSTIDWVLEREEGTVVVVPEAWKFIPQGRGTPVKLAAESFIRQAAGLRNYLWLDSQDIAGVEKMILKSVPVWVLGVQREFNEVKRTLAQIPASVKKPKPEEVSTLELGEFFACYGKHTIKVYVQPSWMGPGEARGISLGEARKTSAPKRAITRSEETTVTEQEARELREENARLRERLDALERQQQPAPKKSAPPEREVAYQRSRSELPPDLAPINSSEDAIYQMVKKRLLFEAEKDPAILRVLTQRPQIDVEVEREVIVVDGKTLRGRIARLLAEGFLEEAARTTGDVFNELARRGGKDAMPGVANELGELARMGFVTRDNKWYRSVPGMNVNIVEKR